MNKLTLTIVAVTRMKTGVCIGGLTADGGKSVRLQQAGGSNWEEGAFHVGEIWEISGTPNIKKDPPHVEDFIVHNRVKRGVEQNVRKFILDRVQPWRGGFLSSLAKRLQ